jgi:hypothetical protein
MVREIVLALAGVLESSSMAAERMYEAVQVELQI